LQVEQAGGIEAGEQYFQQFLKDQGKDYLTYIEDVILEFK
jgi:signal transduction sensor histidine kinase